MIGIWRKWYRDSRAFWMPCLLYCFSTGLLMARQTVPLGLGISPDTVAYIKMARSLLENGLGDLGRDVGVTYPLGYSAVLAGVGWLTNTDPLEAAIALNIVLAVLLVLFFMLEARRLQGVSPWLSGLIITFSLPLFRMSAMALSETLFTLIVFLTLRKASTCDRRPGSLVLLGVMTFFAYLTKYIGITLVPVVVAQIFLSSDMGYRQRWKNSTIYLLVSGALIGTYTWRNFIVSGSFWSDRPPSQTSLIDSLAQARGTMVGWFFPEIPMSGLSLWVLTLVLAGYVWATRRHILRNLRKHARWFVIYPVFLLVNLAVLSFLASQHAFDGLGIRLVTPIYPALAMTLLFMVAPGENKKSTPKLTRVGLWLLVLVLFAQPVRLVFKDIHRRAKEGGGGYNQPNWQNSQMIHECLPQLELAGETILSNGPDVLYILAGIIAKGMPAKRYYNSNVPTGITRENIFDHHPELQGALLIVFFDIEKRRQYLFSREEMVLMCRLELVLECQDGVVFRILGPRLEES